MTQKVNALTTKPDSLHLIHRTHKTRRGRTSNPTRGPMTSTNSPLFQFDDTVLHTSAHTHAYTHTHGSIPAHAHVHTHTHNLKQKSINVIKRRNMVFAMTQQGLTFSHRLCISVQNNCIVPVFPLPGMFLSG